MGNGIPTTEAVRSEMERILASTSFQNAARLSRFLQFTVERTLSGQGSDIKEYLLGVEVFRRGVDFDPRADSVVRVEARRLRAKLDEYYTTAGKDDPISIAYPKGGYVPIFRPRHDEPAAV